MPKTPISIALSDDQLAQIDSVVASGRSPSAAAFIEHAIKIALQDASEWSAMLNQALAETGGPLTDEERAWACSVLTPGSRKI